MSDCTDDINVEIDKRKLRQLIDDGIISPEELANAPLVHIVCPNNADHPLADDGSLCTICRIEPMEQPNA